MSLYTRMLRKFPRITDFSFAYGSGVKQQIGYENVSKRAKMIDFVFTVDDPLEWHTENLELNNHHYSGVKYFGSNFVTKIQQNFGARVYCNTMIEMPDEGVVIKYSVVSVVNLIKDLERWRYLYLAGRLHKPITIIRSTENIKLLEALEKNYESAVRTSLLMLPADFTKYDLFHTLSSLSYTGDFRMIFGENKHKVQNIVRPQLEDFYKLYLPALRKLSNCLTVTSKDTFQQDKSPVSNEKHLQKLPKHLKDTLISHTVYDSTQSDVFAKISKRGDLPQIVSKSVNQIVWRSSIMQSIKNIPTAGISKSAVYSWKKALKTFNM